MNLAEIISSIQLKHQEIGISLNPPASESQIRQTEIKLQFQLPGDFKAFYSICNGFDCSKDQFSMLPVEKLFADNEYGEYGKNCIIFADCMVFSDVWAVRNPDVDRYDIFYNDGNLLVLTDSLNRFLERLLQGHVFEEGGLFKWHEEVKKQQSLS